MMMTLGSGGVGVKLVKWEIAAVPTIRGTDIRVTH